MTFLNPLVLFGLAAAAIPIIIHLLNLRKLRTVEFSSLRFLFELQKTKMRRVRLRQWLLLVLRTLLVASIVLAFARPALTGGLAGVIGSHARTTGVILLDDSPSMTIRGSRGVLFDRAREAAAAAAGLMQEGDEVYLLRLSEVRRLEDPAPARTTGEVLARLAPAAVTAARVPFRDALAAAARILAESRNFNREVYLLSDLQKTQFLAGEGADSADLFDDRVRLFLPDAPESSPGNTGLTDATVTSRILAPGRPVLLRASVRSFGPLPERGGLLSVYLDGNRVLQQSLDIAPGGTVSPSLSVVPGRRGLIRGYLQLEEDALDADNRRYFVLDVPVTIRVLLTGPTAEAVRLTDLALSVGGDSTAATLQVRTVTETQLSAVDLVRYDVVVVCGLTRLPAAEGSRLAAFVRGGGGILLFPGEGTDLESVNSGLLAPLGIPPVGPAVVHGDPAAEGGTSLSFGAVDYEHPLFAGLFEEGTAMRPERHAVESPRVYRSVVPAAGTAGRAVISLSNGTPFLTEYAAGSGRVLLCAVEAGTGWSDLPLKGLFVPLLHRSAAYLAARADRTASFTAGGDLRIRLRLPDRTERDALVLTAPDGTEEKPQPEAAPGSGVLTLTAGQASAVGFYEIRREAPQSAVLATAAVNTDPAESDLEPVDPATLERFLESVGIAPGRVVRMPAGAMLERSVREARFGVELWKYFAALAALFALLEMLVGREPRSAETP